MPVQLRIARLVICALIALAAVPAEAQVASGSSWQLPSQPETARAWLALAYMALRHAFPCERRTS